MAKLSLKIAVPMILAGLFAIAVFVALDYDKLDFSFYVILAILMVYVFSFGFATGQRFASPVKKLLERAKDLSGGDFTTRFYLENKDEIGDLAKVFNKIAEQLEASTSENKQMEKSVDIKVRAKTQALEETINALEQKVKNRTIELERLLSESEKLHKEAMTNKTEDDQLKEELKSLKLKATTKRQPKKIETQEEL